MLLSLSPSLRRELPSYSREEDKKLEPLAYHEPLALLSRCLFARSILLPLIPPSSDRTHQGQELCNHRAHPGCGDPEPPKLRQRIDMAV